MPCPVTKGFPIAPRKDSPVLLKHRLMTQAQCPCQGWPRTLFGPLLQTMFSCCTRFKFSTAMVLKIHVFIFGVSHTQRIHAMLCVNPFWLFSRPTAEDRDLLRVERSGDRIPVGGEIFYTSPGWPWGPPSLLYNGYRRSFQRVTRAGRGVYQPPPLAPRLKNQWSNTPTPPLGLHGRF